MEAWSASRTASATAAPVAGMRRMRPLTRPGGRRPTPRTAAASRRRDVRIARIGADLGRDAPGAGAFAALGARRGSTATPGTSSSRKASAGPSPRDELGRAGARPRRGRGPRTRRSEAGVGDVDTGAASSAAPMRFSRALDLQRAGDDAASPPDLRPARGRARRCARRPACPGSLAGASEPASGKRVEPGLLHGEGQDRARARRSARSKTASITVRAARRRRLSRPGRSRARPCGCRRRGPRARSGRTR